MLHRDKCKSVQGVDPFEQKINYKMLGFTFARFWSTAMWFNKRGRRVVGVLAKISPG